MAAFAGVFGSTPVGSGDMGVVVWSEDLSTLQGMAVATATVNASLVYPPHVVGANVTCPADGPNPLELTCGINVLLASDEVLNRTLEAARLIPSGIFDHVGDYSSDLGYTCELSGQQWTQEHQLQGTFAEGVVVTRLFANCSVSEHVSLGWYRVVVHVSEEVLVVAYPEVAVKLQVSGVTPSQGSVAGGTRVSIAGSGFTSASPDHVFVFVDLPTDSLTFPDGKVPCHVESIEPSSITCVIPPYCAARRSAEDPLGRTCIAEGTVGGQVHVALCSALRGARVGTELP